MNTYRSAVRLARTRSQNDPPAFTGGFSIMKKLLHHPSPSANGFDILKRWQQDHGESPENEPSYETGGFDIVRRLYKHG